MVRRSAGLLVLTLFVACASAQTASPHLFFRVTLGSGMTAPVSGRLLIFLQPGSGAKEIRANEFHPAGTHVAAREVRDLNPGSSVDIDVDRLAYPEPFSTLKPGTYQAQAVL